MDHYDIFKEIGELMAGMGEGLPDAPTQPAVQRNGLTSVPTEVERAIFERTRGLDSEYLPRAVLDACHTHPELEVIPGRVIGSSNAILICLINGSLSWIRTRPPGEQPKIWAEQALEIFRLEDRLTLDWRPISEVDCGFVVEPKFREFDFLISQKPNGRLHQIESRIAIALGLEEFYVRI